MEPPITTQPADHRIPPAEEFYFGTSEDSSPGIDNKASVDRERAPASQTALKIHLYCSSSASRDSLAFSLIKGFILAALFSRSQNFSIS